MEIMERQGGADVPDWPNGARMLDLLREAREASAHVRISLQRRNWQGTVGNWSGAGTGSSIDFQDHRPYLPGDDPRYIDWAAYARSGLYIMKLYREEVSPRLDILLDVSRSMTTHPLRRDRAVALTLFCAESAAAVGATVQVFAVNGASWRSVPSAALFAGSWPQPDVRDAPGAPNLSALPLGHGSLRLLLSDLLYPQPPAEILRTLVAGRGRAVVLAPRLEEEATPDWSGNIEFVDTENRMRRRQRVDGELLARYRAAYQRHFDLWRDAARRYNVRLARIACDVSLKESLLSEAFSQGVVEAWS